MRSDGGRIDVRGRLAALIEVNAGMHGDLTGLENIQLNGAIMGMSRAEINRKLDDIIAFSGLEKFINTPVKRYSTGMQARLGFSTAAHVSPDVLLVDEVLSVGDVAFRHRCEERMRELVKNGAALVFVTHNLEQMRGICEQALVLDAGYRTFIGSPAEAVGHYLKATMDRVGEMSYTDQPREANMAANILDLRFLDEQDEPVVCARPDRPLRIEISFEVERPVPRLTLETTIRRTGGDLFVSLNSPQHGVTFNTTPGRYKVVVELPSFPLAGGNYLAMVRAWDADRSELLGETALKYALQVDDGGRSTGMVAMGHSWTDLEPLQVAEDSEALSAA
jgi:ABC-type multidrug transport system ATPase subunit